MNPEFLQKYAKHHLYDLGEYSEEAYEKFTSECSGFLSTIKQMDRVVWEEVMTMSVSKKSDLMKTILMDNAAEIIPNTYAKNLAELESYVGYSLTDPITEQMKQELCDDLNISEAELNELADDIEIDEGVIDKLKKAAPRVIAVGALAGATYAAYGAQAAIAMTGIAALYYVFKLLKKTVHSMDDLLSDKKTKKASDMIKYLLIGLSILGVGSSLAFSSFWVVIGWVFFMIISMISAINGGNIVMKTVDAGRVLMFAIFKFVKGHDKDAQFSKGYSAIYDLERSQLQGCVKSCGIDDEKVLERMHILKLSVTDRSHLDADPTAADAKRYIKADCLFNCSMRYMISMIAELFGALKSCVENTMQIKLKIRGDALNEIQALSLDPACESIRSELNKIAGQFNQFLDLAFKGNSRQLNQWRQALNSQIMKVMNGQHSRPVSVKYGHDTKISPIVFEF